MDTKTRKNLINDSLKISPVEAKRRYHFAENAYLKWLGKNDRIAKYWEKQAHYYWAYGS